MTTRSIPWPRILAEGVAIVLSILLAFGIQAWWEGRGDEQREAAYLSALGGLGVIESSEIRRQIAQYDGLLGRAVEQQEQHRARFDTEKSPYLRAHASMAEVFGPVIEVGSFPIDDEAFVRNREFANLMVSYGASNSRRRVRSRTCSRHSPRSPLFSRTTRDT